MSLETDKEMRSTIAISLMALAPTIFIDGVEELDHIDWQVSGYGFAGIGTTQIFTPGEINVVTRFAPSLAIKVTALPSLAVKAVLRISLPED